MTFTVTIININLPSYCFYDTLIGPHIYKIFTGDLKLCCPSSMHFRPKGLTGHVPCLCPGTDLFQ